MKTELSRELYNYLIDHIMMDEGVKQVLDVDRVAEAMDVFVNDLKLAVIDIDDWCDQKRLPSPTCLFRPRPTCNEEVTLKDIATTIFSVLKSMDLKRSMFNDKIDFVRENVIAISAAPDVPYTGTIEFYFNFYASVRGQSFEHDLVEKYFFN